MTTHLKRMKELEAERDALAREDRFNNWIRDTLLGKLRAAQTERDALVNRIDFLNQQNSAQQEQNDELTAYAERLSSALEKMLEEFTGEYELLCEQRAVDEGYAALSEAPTTSLARRDAEKQAEGAVLVAEKAWQRTDWDSIGSCPKEWAANHATLLGNELRRLAEGGPE